MLVDIHPSLHLPSSIIQRLLPLCMEGHGYFHRYFGSLPAFLEEVLRAGEALVGGSGRGLGLSNGHVLVGLKQNQVGLCFAVACLSVASVPVSQGHAQRPPQARSRVLLR